ncbi:hypothetical protein Tco_0588914 [Tanacetum coccineum]
MTTLQFADTHNLVAFLAKPAESEGFEQIVDFLNAHTIKYALTVNPTIYTSCIEQFWATVKVKTVNGEVQLQALVDGKKIIVTEAPVRRDLQLNDEEATNQKFNFSKYIFESMVKNLENVSRRFLMYPRFVQVFLEKQLEGMSNHKRISVTPCHTKKIFRNIRSVEKGFSGRETPLFPKMMVQAQEEKGEGLVNLADPHQEDASKAGGVKMMKSNADCKELPLKVLKLILLQIWFGVHDLDEVSVVGKVNTASIATTVSAATIIEDEITLAQALAELKSVKTKVTTATTATTKGILLQETSESITTTIIPLKDKGKGIMFEEPLQMKKKDQISFDEQEAIRLQAEFDEEVRLAREKDEANLALIEE